MFQADAGWYTQDAASRESVGDMQDGADFRRARLAAKGASRPNFNYFFQMDFAFFGRPTFTDVWVECDAICLTLARSASGNGSNRSAWKS